MVESKPKVEELLNAPKHQGAKSGVWGAGTSIPSSSNYCTPYSVVPAVIHAQHRCLFFFLRSKIKICKLASLSKGLLANKTSMRRAANKKVRSKAGKDVAVWNQGLCLEVVVDQASWSQNKVARLGATLHCH
ncbi:uncharacterized protein BDCG_07221 [Blastomyces dermatitidis ER-3]|uniref:Uncharacterized protein n=1 Tax=Ajellomyces dermatitidis (strain ER-3 / ATCC MYA-2586) TaxID=559297 RepID=A0ABP2F509_AJEDR|nr:uncharacterized protein BDCG_07221 [Blastomyces dermatitidis ER-3]EEQ92101.1 hypothetical protein BDCG_07221 [Blastomyces dermatitidis ER-3]